MGTTEVPDSSKATPSHCAFFRIGRRPIRSGISRSGSVKVKRTVRGPTASALATLAQAVW